jgi:hypothetical protein
LILGLPGASESGGSGPMKTVPRQTVSAAVGNHMSLDPCLCACFQPKVDPQIPRTGLRLRVYLISYAIFHVEAGTAGQGQTCRRCTDQGFIPRTHIIIGSRSQDRARSCANVDAGLRSSGSRQCAVYPARRETGWNRCERVWRVWV